MKKKEVVYLGDQFNNIARIIIFVQEEEDMFWVSSDELAPIAADVANPEQSLREMRAADIFRAVGAIDYAPTRLEIYELSQSLIDMAEALETKGGKWLEGPAVAFAQAAPHRPVALARVVARMLEEIGPVHTKEVLTTLRLASKHTSVTASAVTATLN